LLAEVKLSSGTGGGPFSVSARNGFLPRWGPGDDLFYTFCAESGITFTPGTWYWCTVDDRVYSGSSGISGDPISDVTEWIFDRWTNGNPDGWSNEDVYKSIWAAEEETGGDTSKDPYQDALTHFGYSVPADFGSAVHTMALNLWKNWTCVEDEGECYWEATDVQSQLISVDSCTVCPVGP